MKNVSIWTIIQSLGNFLSGIAILFLFLDFITRRRAAFSASYSEKIERTFSYINRLDSFRHIHFLNLYNYKKITQSIIGNKRGEISLKLYDVDPTGRVVMVGMSEARETLRKNLTELFYFFKELVLLLKDVEKHKLVDKQILYENFERYRVNINEFFEATNHFLKHQETSKKEPNGLYGDFTKKDISSLKKELIELGFDFIK